MLGEPRRRLAERGVIGQRIALLAARDSLALLAGLIPGRFRSASRLNTRRKGAALATRLVGRPLFEIELFGFLGWLVVPRLGLRSLWRGLLRRLGPCLLRIVGAVERRLYGLAAALGPMLGALALPTARNAALDV
jgi:hypothetical protein